MCVCIYIYIYICVYLFIYNISTYIKGFRSICGLVGASNRRSAGMIKSNVREDMAEIGCSYIPMATYPVAKLKKMKVRSHKIHPRFIYTYMYIYIYIHTYVCIIIYTYMLHPHWSQICVNPLHPPWFLMGFMGI